MNKKVEMKDSASAFVVSAAGAQFGDRQPKPTAVTPGVEEALSGIWQGDGADVGYWQCTPGRFTAVRDGYTEVCHILSGSATVRSEDGTEHELVPGGTFVMPDGWRGEWDVLETMTKLYVLIDRR